MAPPQREEPDVTVAERSQGHCAGTLETLLTLECIHLWEDSSVDGNTLAHTTCPLGVGSGRTTFSAISTRTIHCSGSLALKPRMFHFWQEGRQRKTAPDERKKGPMTPSSVGRLQLEIMVLNRAEKTLSSQLYWPILVLNYC